jgi:hypothetical protein
MLADLIRVCAEGGAVVDGWQRALRRCRSPPAVPGEGASVAMSKAFCDMRVFLSSTKQDLEAEREIVFYALDGIGHEVVRMEEYGSRSFGSWKVCEKELDRCDAYVLLIGTRYGSELTETGLSYTHAEFERAKIKGIPIVAFIKAGLPDKRASADAKRLNEFVDLVNASYNVRRPYFEIGELGAAVREGVANIESDGRSDPPTFHQVSRALADPERYAVTRTERNLLDGQPYSIVIVDLHVLPALKYPEDATVRLRNKALQLRADLLRGGLDAKIFNEIDQEGSSADEIIAKRAVEAQDANAIVILIQQKADVPLLGKYFSTSRGERIVCYPSFIDEPKVSPGTRLLRYTPQELDSCNLVAEVHNSLDHALDDYLLSIAA